MISQISKRSRPRAHVKFRRAVIGSLTPPTRYSRDLLTSYQRCRPLLRVQALVVTQESRATTASWDREPSGRDGMQKSCRKTGELSEFVTCHFLSVRARLRAYCLSFFNILENNLYRQLNISKVDENPFARVRQSSTRQPNIADLPLFPPELCTTQWHSITLHRPSTPQHHASRRRVSHWRGIRTRIFCGA
jgi:hypothetical protein